jgi:hypothetical protein
MWENQVELLTRHCRVLSDQIDQMDQRMEYFENVIVTLLTALKAGGIIQDTSDETNTYEFD